MLLFVEDKYGVTQVNDSGKPIDIKALREAFYIAKSKNYNCDFALWNEDMTYKIYCASCKAASMYGFLDKILEYDY